MKIISKRKKGLICGIAIGLVIILLIGTLGYLSSGFKNWDTKEWLNDKQPITENIIGTDNNDNKLIDGNTYEMPIAMTLFSVGTMSTGITLTATVNPWDAYDKKVDWTLAWANPSSTWASGKNASSYLTVTPTADGALTATVNCVQAFGEQIIITVMARANPDAKTNCTVDYAKKITDVNVKKNGVALPTATIALSGSEQILTVDSVISTGTINDTFKYDVSVEFTDTMKNLINSRTSWSGYIGSTIVTLTTQSSSNCEIYFSESTIYYMFGGSSAAMSWLGSNRNLMRELLMEASGTSDGALKMSFKFTGTHSSYTKTFNVKIDTATLQTLITEITLSQSNILF